MQSRRDLALARGPTRYAPDPVGKKSAAGLQVAPSAARPTLFYLNIGLGSRPDRARTVSWAPSLLLPSHPKSSVHRYQCRRQNCCDSNARKIIHLPSENS
jgi:hypothetical protein